MRVCNFNAIYLLSCLLIGIHYYFWQRDILCDLKVDCFDHMGLDNESSKLPLLRKIRQSELIFLKNYHLKW